MGAYFFYKKSRLVVKGDEDAEISREAHPQHEGNVKPSRALAVKEIEYDHPGHTGENKRRNDKRERAQPEREKYETPRKTHDNADKPKHYRRGFNRL